MVKKFFGFINKEIGGIHQAAYLLGFFAFLSQVLALVRDRLLAYFFGASHTLDLYYASFRIPDFLFASIASVVSISVLIPFLMEKLDASEEEGKKFIDDVFSIFFLFIGVVSAVVFFLIPFLVSRFFPGFVGSDQTELISLTRIMLLSPILLGFSNFFASITQVYKRFFIYALSPLLYNIGIIVGIVFLYPLFGMRGLVYGVIIGAIFHGGIQIPFLLERGLFPKFKTSVNFSSLRRIALLSLPRTVTASSNEIAESFLIAFASIMSAGSISIFNFSFNLQSVPLSIVGVSYALAAFPALTRHYSNGNRAEFLAQMMASAKHIVFLCTPVALFFITLRAQIVRVLLGSGHFNWTDTRLTAAALALFIISIVPQSLMPLFVRSYYARGKTRAPLIINFISASFLVTFAYFLSHAFLVPNAFRNFLELLLRVQNLPGTSVLALPLAFSVGLTLNMSIHWIDFHQHYPEFTRPVMKTFLQSFTGSLVMGFVSYEMLQLLSGVFNLNTAFGIFAQGFIAGIVGIFFFILTLRLMKSEELEEIWQTLHKKIWKTKVIAAEQTRL